MKLTTKQIKKVRVLLFVIILLSGPVIHAIAGPDDPGGDPGAPIDGGISLLVAAGIGYGAKKVYASRKKAKGAAADENGAAQQV